MPLSSKNKGYSKLKDTPTSDNHTTNPRTTTTSHSHSTTATSSSTDNNPASTLADRHYMWQCCECGYQLNDYDPNKPYHPDNYVQCDNSNAHHSLEASLKALLKAKNRHCVHHGPCIKCDKHSQEVSGAGLRATAYRPAERG